MTASISQQKDLEEFNTIKNQVLSKKAQQAGAHAGLRSKLSTSMSSNLQKPLPNPPPAHMNKCAPDLQKSLPSLPSINENRSLAPSPDLQKPLPSLPPIHNNLGRDHTEQAVRYRLHARLSNKDGKLQNQMQSSEQHSAVRKDTAAAMQDVENMPVFEPRVKRLPGSLATAVSPTSRRESSMPAPGKEKKE